MRSWSCEVPGCDEFPYDNYTLCDPHLRSFAWDLRKRLRLEPRAADREQAMLAALGLIAIRESRKPTPEQWEAMAVAIW